MSEKWASYVSEHSPIEREEQWIAGDGVMPTQEIDEVLRSVVASVIHHGGEATTSEIKAETGLSNQKILYRFEKLERYGIAEISQKKTSTHGIPPKICRLTEKGIFAVEERGLGGDDAFGNETVTRADEVTITKEQLHEFQQELERLENRLNASESIPSAVDGTENVLEDRIREVESRVKTIDMAIAATFRCLREELDVDPREYVESIREEKSR